MTYLYAMWMFVIILPLAAHEPWSVSGGGGWLVGVKHLTTITI